MLDQLSVDHFLKKLDRQKRDWPVVAGVIGITIFVKGANVCQL